MLRGTKHGKKLLLLCVCVCVFQLYTHNCCIYLKYKHIRILDSVTLRTRAALLDLACAMPDGTIPREYRTVAISVKNRERNNACQRYGDQPHHAEHGGTT